MQKNTKYAKQTFLDRRFTRKIKPRKTCDGNIYIYIFNVLNLIKFDSDMKSYFYIDQKKTLSYSLPKFAH